MPHLRPTARAILAALALLAAGPAAAQTMTLAQRIEQCGTCHGRDGNSTTELIPSLAAQPEFFLLNQLVLFREGVRAIEPMVSLVKSLSDDELTALAQHYAALPAARTAETPDAGKVKAGEALAETLRCASCHLPSLSGQEQMPRLAGQRIDYMIVQLKAYRDSQRSGADPLMSATVAGVPDADLVALAHYAASR